MALATGARTQFALSPETTFKTLPTTGWRTVLVSSINISHGYDALSDEVVQGHDARSPVRNTKTAEASVSLPLDTAAIGPFLRTLLGAPSTTGSGPYTHVFDPVSPATPVRTYSLEQWDSDAGVSRRVRGAAATRLQLTATARNIPQVSVDFVAAAVDVSATLAASSATALAGTIVKGALANLKFDGAAAGPVLEASLTIEAPRDFDFYVDSGDEPDAVVLSNRYSASARIRARLLDNSLVNRMVNGTATNLELEWVVSASDSVVFRMPSARCDRVTGRVDGPGGVELEMEFVAAATATLPSVRVTLVNSVSSY